MAKVRDWSKYANFSEEEFTCSHSGKCEMEEEFMDSLQALRTEYGKPIDVTSGFRDESHPEERDKDSIGTHPLGLAVDIRAEKGEAYELLRLAIKYGFTGIGLFQKGTHRLIHLDKATSAQIGKPRPTVWTY